METTGMQSKTTEFIEDKPNRVRASLIVPTYKRARDLTRLFRSIIVQTLRPIEVIVVDDTPTQEIEELSRDWELSFSKVGIKLNYVKNPYNRSAAIAKNVGAEKAKGKIFVFLDSDVILYPKYIEKVVEVFEMHPDAKGVEGLIINAKKLSYIYQIFAKMFSLYHYSINSRKLWEYPKILTKIVSCEWLSSSCMAVKREIFEMGFKFDENLKQYSLLEDVLFSHLIYKQFSGSLYMTPYAKYIHNQTQEGREYDEEHLNKCRKYVLTKLFGKKGLIVYYKKICGLLLIKKLRRI